MQAHILLYLLGLLKGRGGARVGEGSNKAWLKAELDPQTVTAFSAHNQVRQTHTALTGAAQICAGLRITTRWDAADPPQGNSPFAAQQVAQVRPHSRQQCLAQGHFSSARCLGTRHMNGGTQLVHSVVTWRALLCFFSPLCVPKTSPLLPHGIHFTRVNISNNKQNKSSIFSYSFSLWAQKRPTELWRKIKKKTIGSVAQQTKSLLSINETNTIFFCYNQLQRLAVMETQTIWNN